MNSLKYILILPIAIASRFIWRAHSIAAASPLIRDVDNLGDNLVLYLRSFDLDHDTRFISWVLFSHLHTIEMEIYSMLSRIDGIDDLVAIGKPKEKLIPVGFKRLYIDNSANWKAIVIRLMQKSCCIIWAFGHTEGLKWELQQVLKKADPVKLILYAPLSKLSPRQKEKAWSAFRQEYNTYFPVELPISLGKAFFIKFDIDWNPTVIEPPLLIYEHQISPQIGLLKSLQCILDEMNLTHKH